MLAGRRRPGIAIGVVEQRGEVAVADEDDVAAAPAVAAVGAAQGNELLAPERGDARPAVAGFDVDDYSIDEHDLSDPANSRPEQAQ